MNKVTPSPTILQLHLFIVEYKEEYGTRWKKDIYQAIADETYYQLATVKNWFCKTGDGKMPMSIFRLINIVFFDRDIKWSGNDRS